MNERDLERYATEQAEKHSVFCRKAQWVNKNGAPDRLFLFRGLLVWVEFKTPSGRVSTAQQYEHALMRSHGQRVEVIREKSEVDRLIAELLAQPKIGQALSHQTLARTAQDREALAAALEDELFTA